VQEAEILSLRLRALQHPPTMGDWDWLRDVCVLAAKGLWLLLLGAGGLGFFFNARKQTGAPASDAPASSKLLSGVVEEAEKEADEVPVCDKGDACCKSASTPPAESACCGGAGADEGCCKVGCVLGSPLRMQGDAGVGGAHQGGVRVAWRMVAPCSFHA
jgi:hypothetical protein